jgi:hypothetical protein
VAENLAMCLGQPVAAFPDQDQLAHIQTHCLFAEDPNFGGNPIYSSTYLPAFVQHMKEHIALYYTKLCYDLGTKAAGVPLEHFMVHRDEDTRAEFDRLMAVVAVAASKEAGPVLQRVNALIAKVNQQVEASKPPMPMDPSQVAAQDVQRQMQKDQQDAQLEAQKLQQTGAADQAKLAQKEGAEQRQAALAKEKEDNRLREQGAKLAQQAKEHADRMLQEQADREEEAIIARNRDIVDQRMNTEDNETAIEIAAARAKDRQDKVGGMTSGTGVTNPNP